MTQFSFSLFSLFSTNHCCCFFGPNSSLPVNLNDRCRYKSDMWLCPTRFKQKTNNILFIIITGYTWAASWKNQRFAYVKTKTQISFAVTAKLISACVFNTQLVQSVYFLNPKFQASSHLMWLHSPVCVGPCRKTNTLVFSCRGSL